MKLEYLNPNLSLYKFKQVLVDNGFLFNEGVADSNHIYIGGHPTSDAPTCFASILSNGNTIDLNPYGEQIIMLTINVKLLAPGVPNTIMSDRIFNKLGSILQKPKTKDGYTFVYRKMGVVSDSISLNAGYSTKIMNIYVRIIKP